MIVFWRLVLVYYICAILFYNQRFFAWRERHPNGASVLQTVVFGALAAFLCLPYLTLDWPVADIWSMPGWGGIIIVSVLYSIINRLFVYRKGQKRGYTLTFLIHDVLAILALLVCSPLYELYRSGDLMSEPVTLFWIGVIVVTRMFSIFIYMVEQDLYGRDYPTLDESFVTMLMRLIFFLIVLLPGWRWVLWFIVWFLACVEADRNRLMDLSRFAFYFSIFGATAIGFLVRYSWG